MPVNAGSKARTHIVSHKVNGALTQRTMFTRDGSGSLSKPRALRNIKTSQHRRCRRHVLELIEPLEQAGVLVKRSREALENEIECFQCA